MENNMVMEQSDDAQNKRQKLGVNSSDDAKKFLVEVLGQAEADLLEGSHFTFRMVLKCGRLRIIFLRKLLEMEETIPGLIKSLLVL
jgi:hypothetical protein